MRIAVIGLGSMGKRRLRNLASLGCEQVAGFDPRPDRIAEARALGADAQPLNAWPGPRGFDALIVSTPPDRHLEYLRGASAARVPVFVEASVILDGLEELSREVTAAGTVVCPSCTLRFHPAIRELKRIVTQRSLGAATNFIYHSGQYLPDWHPWEDIRDYYVSQRQTGGAREIVPFELTWLVDVFGPLTDARCTYGRTLNLGVDIDDVYAFSGWFGGRTLGAVMVDVTARVAQRRLTLNFERGLVSWDWNAASLRIEAVEQTRSETINFALRDAAPGYHPSISEGMYIDEMRAFLDAARGAGSFPNSLADDVEVLRILRALEGGR
jgi:predicted dehydrogenase